LHRKRGDEGKGLGKRRSALAVIGDSPASAAFSGNADLRGRQTRLTFTAFLIAQGDELRF